MAHGWPRCLTSKERRWGVNSEQRAELRKLAEEKLGFIKVNMSIDPTTVLALLDRIEELEIELRKHPYLGHCKVCDCEYANDAGLNLIQERDRLHGALTCLRQAQKEYMADRGNEAKGKAVGLAAQFADDILALNARTAQTRPLETNSRLYLDHSPVEPE